MLNLLLCLVLLCLACAPAVAMTITSDAPGNVFVAGSPIELSVRDAQGGVNYEVVDYFGGKPASGEAASTITLPDLKPGWYDVRCKDAAGEASVSIGVVMDRGDAPLARDGRVCVDVAGAWLTKPENFRGLARMIRIAGIPWVRERLSWGGTQTQDGKLRWGRYQGMADAYAAEGVNICQHWSDTPSWTRPDSRAYPLPNDLRDLYRYTRAASSHFSRQIAAWEVWNEPDGGIPSSDVYAAMVKAAYLGLKAGNPKAEVLLGSLCRGVTNFSDDLYESGCTGYFDTFNWHIYSKPAIYPGAFAAHLDALRKYGAAGRPAWITEAGVVVKGTEGPAKRILNLENQRTQCRFVPRSMAMSLAAGTDKHFFFVLLDYTEGDTQWGALRPDLTPYASFPAISASANIIGESAYRGEYKPGNDMITAQVFSTPRGNVLVAWSDTEAEMVVPTDRRSVRVADIFGAQSSIDSANGAVKVKVGPDAVYLLDIGKPIERKLTGRPRPPGELPALQPSPVVLVGYTSLPMLKDSDAYRLSDQGEFDYSVDVYNFDEKSPTEGVVEVVAPRGWTVQNARRRVALEAFGRQALTFRVKPGAPAAGRRKLMATAKLGSGKVSPSISAFSFDPALLTPSRRKPLDWAPDAAKWKPDASPSGKLTLSNPQAGDLHYDISFTGIGDRWVYPILELDDSCDMSGFDGIALDLTTPGELPGTVIRIMLVERSGAHYISTTPAPSGKRRVVFLFRNMERLEFMGADDNGRLDLDSISKVKLGCNAGQAELSFDVSGFELVKFD